MGKININGLEVELLGNLKLNGHNYVFGLVNNDLNFYELTKNEFGLNYVLPKKDYTLEGNAGGSLRELNGRIFLKNFADDLKNDIKVGKLRNIDDISKEISNMQEVFNEMGPEDLKAMFKVSNANLDDQSLMENAKNVYSQLNSKRKDKGRKEKNKGDFEIIDGGNSGAFSTTKEELPKKVSYAEQFAADEFRSPTMSELFLKELKRTEKPSVEKPKPEVESVPEPTPVFEPVIEPKVEEPIIKESPLNEVSSREEVEDPTLLLPKIETKSNSDLNEFSQLEPGIENTITSMDDYRQLAEARKHVSEAPEEEHGKVKTLGSRPATVSSKAAYVDTVILCLLVQLGIFGLLIFVLLLIK